MKSAEIISQKNSFHLAEDVNFVKKKTSCVMNAVNIFLTIEKIVFFYITMSDNKLVKTIMEAATLTGLASAGQAKRS